MPSWATGSSWSGWSPGAPRPADLASPGTTSWVYRQVSNGAGLYIDASGNLWTGLATRPTNYGSTSSALSQANSYASANGGWGTTPSAPTLVNPSAKLTPYVAGYANEQVFDPAGGW